MKLTNSQLLKEVRKIQRQQELILISLEEYFENQDEELELDSNIAYK